MENLVGKTLGKYRVVARLGSGGMAEVYKAYHSGLDRYVAIKVMHDYLSKDEQFVKRFRREALALGKLSHPNIVPVLDFDQEADFYFMVMQFINGPTLKDEFTARLRQRRSFSLHELARIYQALGEAMTYAHSRDMVHRDLKPANIMIDEEGQILLTDFGIARILDATRYTATGALAGTPSYMSPEQGQGAKLDGRSDIYAMGVILYELSTGRVPYKAHTPIATIMKHVSAPLPPPTRFNSNLPGAVEQVIVKAMSKKPEARYQTARDMAQALREAVGLPPGDTLRRHPLRTVSPPPNIDQELDPHTGAFSTVNAPLPQTHVAVATPTQPNLPPPEPAAAPPPPRRRGMSLLLVAGSVLLLLLVAAVAAGLWLFSGTNTGPQTAQTTPTDDLPVTGTAQAVALESGQEATTTAVWLSEDDDGDGLTNAQEIDLGTRPDRRDTDEDGLNDAAEIEQYQTDPLKADTDSDGLNDGEEIQQGLNPRSDDTDGDGLSDAGDPDPGNLPTPTPTLTPASTSTSSPTASPSATATAMPIPTEEPTVTPTTGSSQVRTSLSAAPPGIFQDFESAGSWRRGDQPYGEFSRTSAKHFSGSFAGQLDYNFPTTENDFVVFSQPRALAGEPKAISAQVYGDGAGHFLNVWIKDSAGQVWGMSFGQIEHTGWQEMTALLDPGQPWPSGHISGPDNGQIDYPISFEALVLDDGNDGFSGSGTIYIDNLTSQSDASTPASTPAATAPAPPSGSTGPPSASNGRYRLEVGQKFTYIQPWGAPRSGDPCQALRDQDWDDTRGIYRSLTVEMALSNQTQNPVPDNWGGVEYQTGAGERGTLCRYEYPGSGPPPGETRSVTFFALIDLSDYVQYIRLNNLDGPPLELCFKQDGSGC